VLLELLLLCFHTELPFQNLEKVIPDQPKQSTPVHLRTKQIFAHNSIPPWEKPFIPGKSDAAEAA
jgi:NADH dehydrogenase (ubiquinone) 1 alpha subcomplex subunit 8